MTTRFTNGLTTAAPSDPLGDFILPDMTKAHVYMEDFDYYDAANWTVTEVGVAAQNLQDADGGRLLITNAGLDNDATFMQKDGESFLFATGKKLWFDCLMQVSESIQTDIVMGLQITDTSPLSVTDGVYFIKADGAATVDFVVVKNSTATTTSAIATMVDATNIQLSYFYDGKDSIKIFVDGVQVGSSVTTNLPDDEVLTISYGLQNGEASIKSLLIDYVMAAKER